ncbi:23S rRNA (guanosine(2251)-2'-O)-methyltransferase RlmB [Candidatus Margulisiibacteriota bacterium]
MSEYLQLDDLLQPLKNPFLLILDGIEDPHNFGAILRTAECVGIDGLIIRKNRQVQVTDTVIKVSTGAAKLVKIARVPNIAEVIRKLQNQAIKVIGLENSGAVEITAANLKLPIALVIGSEGKGISHLVKQRCDSLVKIPMKGKISSLNASVSAGVALYEVLRQNKI